MIIIRLQVVFLCMLCSAARLDANSGWLPPRLEQGGRLELLPEVQTVHVSDEAKRQAMSDLAKRKSTFAYPVWTVPTMANVQGQFGAFFKTRVVLFNPTALNYVVAVSLYGPNGTIEIRGTNMPPNTQKVWNDFLGEAFGYSGAGAVQFDSWFIPPGGSGDFDFYVTAEVYTDSPNGRYKTMVVNGIRPDGIVTTINNTTRRTSSIGLSVSSTERTNLGVLNETSTAITVTAQVFENAVLKETITFPVPPRGWAQKPVTVATTNGTVEWTTTGEAYLWMVVVDNQSNDGSLTYPAYLLP